MKSRQQLAADTRTRARLRAGLPTHFRMRRGSPSGIIYSVRHVGHLSRSRAFGRIRALWSVPRADVDLWLVGRRDT